MTFRTLPRPGPAGVPVAKVRPARRAEGFTVLEVALATFVMAFAISTSIIALQTGFRAIDVARDSTIAAQIMQSEIERLRLLPWNSTATVTGIRDLPASAPVTVTATFSASTTLAAKFQVTRAVAADDARPNDVRYITLNVSWRTSDGRQQARSFTTMYARNGLYDYYYTLANPNPTS